MMTIARARELTKEWQDIFGLSGWKIHVRWAKTEDKCEDCFGCCMWFTEEATAQIVLNKKLADEETIIHEILHLLLEGHLPEPTAYDALYELAINKMSKIILKGKRSNVQR